MRLWQPWISWSVRDVGEGSVRTFVPRWRHPRGKKENGSGTGFAEEVEEADEVGEGLTGALSVVGEGSGKRLCGGKLNPRSTGPLC